MLLNTTPSGNNLQRKMLLNHSLNMRNLFCALLLLLLPLSIIIGNYYSKATTETGDSDLLKNIAMVMVQGDTSIKQGTAFLVCKDDGTPSGYLFTARHVVAETISQQVDLTFPRRLDANGDPVTTTATIVWTTNVPFDGADMQTLRYDVCLLKLDDMSIPELEECPGFIVGTEIGIKDPISIYGFPGGTEYATTGEVSSTNYNDENNLMLLSFQIDHGLSGAPIYNDNGEVLGIAIASEQNTDIKNIALKMSRVLELMDRDGKSGLLQ